MYAYWLAKNEGMRAGCDFDCKFFLCGCWLLGCKRVEMEEDRLRGAAQIKGEGVRSDGGFGVAKCSREENKVAAM